MYGIVCVRVNGWDKYDAHTHAHSYAHIHVCYINSYAKIHKYVLEIHKTTLQEINQLKLIKILFFWNWTKCVAFNSICLTWVKIFTFLYIYGMEEFTNFYTLVLRIIYSPTSRHLVVVKVKFVVWLVILLRIIGLQKYISYFVSCLTILLSITVN